METAYQDWERRRQQNKPRPRSVRRSRPGAKVTLGVRERRRLIQLAVCVVLFLVIYVGKGVFPDQMLALRAQILTAMGSDTDFTAVFSNLGRSLSAGEPVADTLGELWVEVFGGAAVEEQAALPGEGSLFRTELDYLTGDGEGTPVSRTLALSLTGEEASATPQAEPTPTPTATPAPSAAPTPAPSAEPEVIHMDYTGPALPDNTTMDQYRLDVGQTVTPALGWVSSPFGWREHPVDGEEKFHNGVDLAVNNGTEVQAFADGVIDYIGDSPIYGLYLQIKHDGGVTTFYAHCSKLCVQQGESVSAGQKVAESGDTGNATGPHLHFEIKKDGVRLNPLYYIETQ